MPSASAVFVRLPSYRPRTWLMNRFSNSRTASSNWTSLSTISATRRSIFSAIIVTRSPALGKIPTGQPPERFDVFLACPGHHVIRERGDRRLLVPLDGFEIVAHELLVEARLRAAPPVGVARPEAGRIRRQHLVDHDQPIRIGPPVGRHQSEFELRVCDDDP